MKTYDKDYDKNKQEQFHYRQLNVDTCANCRFGDLGPDGVVECEHPNSGNIYGSVLGKCDLWRCHKEINRKEKQ